MRCTGNFSFQPISSFALCSSPPFNGCIGTKEGKHRSDYYMMVCVFNAATVIESHFVEIETKRTFLSVFTPCGVRRRWRSACEKITNRIIVPYRFLYAPIRSIFARDFLAPFCELQPFVFSKTTNIVLPCVPSPCVVGMVQIQIRFKFASLQNWDCSHFGWARKTLTNSMRCTFKISQPQNNFIHKMIYI